MVYKIFEFLQIWHFYFEFIKQYIPLEPPTEFNTLLLHIYFGFIYFAPLNYVDKCFCSFCSYVLYTCVTNTLYLLFCLFCHAFLQFVGGLGKQKKRERKLLTCVSIEKKKKKLKEMMPWVFMPIPSATKI